MHPVFPIVASLGVVSGAHAVFFRSDTPLPGTAAVIDFEDRTLPRFTPITTQYEPQGVTFPTTLLWNRLVNDFPNITGNKLGNDPNVGPVRVRFTQPQTRAAFAVACNRSDLTVSAYLGTQLVEQATFRIQLADIANIVGFTGIIFDEVRIDQAVVTGTAGMVIDLIHFGGVEPPGCDPDLNSDGNTDQEDVACLIDTVAGNPGCTAQDPDFNADGNVDQEDVAALITAVAGDGCP